MGGFVADVAHLLVIQDSDQALSPEHARRRVGINAADEVPQGSFPATTEDNHESSISGLACGPHTQGLSCRP
jgi:hypothetical protein